MRQATTESATCQRGTPHYVGADNMVRGFIKQQYKETFNANIQVTFPHLIALQNNDGSTVSAIGYRDGKAPFFVEHYFDWPVEDTLSQKLGYSVNRLQIVELGNLAATSKRHTIALLQKTWSALHSLGYGYVVFSGTQSVMRLFKSLPYSVITDANPDAVPMVDDWGSTTHINQLLSAQNWKTTINVLGLVLTLALKAYVICGMGSCCDERNRTFYESTHSTPE